MIRTQIYIPDDIHSALSTLAKTKGVSLSNLIREGAKEVIKKNYGNMSPREKALKFFANPPRKSVTVLKQSVEKLVRNERD